MKVYIKPAKEEYLDQIDAIEQKSFASPWSKQLLHGEIVNDNSVMVCAVSEDETVLGYGGFVLMYDTAHIVNVAVREDARRLGIAYGIMRALLSLCEVNGIYDITLEVRVSNQSAIKLYEKCGFTSAGVRKGYYANNHEDALIMWKHLEKEENGDEKIN